MIDFMIPSTPRDRLHARIASRKQDTLGHVLTRLSRLFHEHALQAVHAAGFHDIRESWIGLLRHSDPDGIRSSVLAARLGVTRQAAGQLVSELESHGYLERVPDPSDGRAKLVRMTDRGLAAWATGLDALAAMQDDLAAELGSATLTTLHTHGAALLDALERRSDHTAA